MPTGIPITNDVINKEILPRLVKGETQTSIAKKLGYDQTTISQQKAKLLPRLQAIQLAIIDQVADTAVSNTVKTIERANQVLTDPNIDNKQISEYRDILYLSDRKEQFMMRAMGIGPGDTQSPQIGSMIQVNNINVIDPRLRSVYNKELEGYSDDIAEAEWTDDP